MKIRLGIIGAGQLGMYLCEAASKLGLETAVMAEHSDDPAVYRADQVFLGNPEDMDCLERFLRATDFVTFEKEDVPNEMLARIAAAERDGEVVCNPSAQTMFMLKDKGLQKNWMAEYGLPRLSHRVIHGGNVDMESLLAAIKPPLVQKTRSGGYDGLGVQILRTHEDMEKLWPVPSVIEPFLQRCQEVSVVVARNLDGELVSFPPFAMEFDDRFNALDQVSMPATIPEYRLREAVAVAERAVGVLGDVGVFAVEMFLSDSGDLLINEISPRVHNSAHLTMEACGVSQFEQHVRAVVGLPLAEIGHVQPAVMLNLLYDEDMDDSCPPEPTSYVNDFGATVHWYGKEPGRIGRKMGHITALADETLMAAELAERSRMSLTQRSDAAA